MSLSYLKSVGCQTRLLGFSLMRILAFGEYHQILSPLELFLKLFHTLFTFFTHSLCTHSNMCSLLH